MTEQERKTRRVRVRNAKPYPGIAFTNYASIEDDEGFAFYYLQISRTLGLERSYDHPELQTLITLSTEAGGSSVLTYLVKQVRNGVRYHAGDRVEVPDPFCPQSLHTVELRESCDCYGPCLRAVVLGMEDAYQSMSEGEALAYLNAHGPLTDPYAAYY